MGPHRLQLICVHTSTGSKWLMMVMNLNTMFIAKVTMATRQPKLKQFEWARINAMQHRLIIISIYNSLNKFFNLGVAIIIIYIYIWSEWVGSIFIHDIEGGKTFLLRMFGPWRLEICCSTFVVKKWVSRIVSGLTFFTRENERPEDRIWLLAVTRKKNGTGLVTCHNMLIYQNL